MCQELSPSTQAGKAARNVALSTRHGEPRTPASEEGPFPQCLSAPSGGRHGFRSPFRAWRGEAAGLPGIRQQPRAATKVINQLGRGSGRQGRGGEDRQGQAPRQGTVPTFLTGAQAGAAISGPLPLSAPVAYGTVRGRGYRTWGHALPHRPGSQRLAPRPIPARPRARRRRCRPRGGAWARA